MRKGRSVFITTTLMVVLLIVALSTATYAWFSASNVVSIATISFTAVSRTDGDGAEIGGAIKLSWTQNAAEETLQSEISIANGVNMAPMIPKVAPVFGVTTFEDFVAAGNFFTASQTTVQDDVIYASGPIQCAPYICANPSDLTDTVFYLYNTGSYNMSVTVSYDIDGENADALRVAVFVDGVLRGIMAEESVSYGVIVKNSNVADQTSIENAAITFSLGANGSSAIRLVAWYDGKFLGDEGATKAAELKDLSFAGSYVA